MAKNGLMAVDKDGVRCIVPPEMKPQLSKAIRARAKAKQMETDAKAMSKKANEQIMGIMAVAGAKTAVVDGVGTVILKAGKSVTYNKDKISQYLLEKGVSAKVVGNAIEAGKKESMYDSVEFKLQW
jgi:hypothetical protein